MNINKNEISSNNENKAIPLSDMKKSNKKSKIPFDKKNYRQYKKNIRIAINDIEDVDDNAANKTTEINYMKIRPNKINSTFNLGKSNSHTNIKNTTNYIHIKELSHKKNN